MSMVLGDNEKPLSDRELQLVSRLFSDPTAFPVGYRAWLKGLIELEPPPPVAFDPGIEWEDVGDDPSGGPGFAAKMAEIAAVVPNALRGYWRLGEGGLGPYADLSGYRDGAGNPQPHPMVRSAQVTPMTDLARGALPLDDDDGAVQFNEYTGLAPSRGDFLTVTNNWGTGTSNPFEWPPPGLKTLIGFVRPLTQPTSNTFDGGIVCYYAQGSGFYAGLSLGVQWPDRRLFFLRNTNRLLGPVMPANQWAFVVATKDATSDRLYVNGSLVATGPPIDTGSSFNTSPLIGMYSGSHWQTLYGGVDEVSVWNRTLTDSEIAALASAGGFG